MSDTISLLVCLVVIVLVIYWNVTAKRDEDVEDRQSLTAPPDSAGRAFHAEVSSLFPVTGKPARWRTGLALDPVGQRLVVKNGPHQRVIAFGELVHVEPLYNGRSVALSDQRGSG